MICLILTLITATLAGCQIFLPDFSKDSSNANTVDVENVVVNFASTDGERDKGDLVEAINNVYDSVVCIEVIKGNSLSRGSGVLIDVDVITKDNKVEENCFYIMTCFHVINNVSEVRVFLVDDNYNYSYGFSSNDFKVSLVGGDEATDIAVLKLDITSNPYGLKKEDITLAKMMDVSKNKLALGEQIFTIGNPTGALPGTVTTGIVSFINRKTSVEGDIYTLIQIDAALNKGNSGGGLFNLYGELVGMTNAGNSTYEGLNYAIPLEVNIVGEEDTGLIRIVTELLKNQTEESYGYVEGRWQIGFTLQDHSVTDVFGRPTGETYVYISSILENSALSKATSSTGAKVKTGYVLVGVEVNGKTYEIISSSDFAKVNQILKEELKIGDSFKLLLKEKYSSINTVAYTVNVEQYVYTPNLT